MHPELIRIPALHLFGHAFGPTVIFTYGFVLACAFLLGILWGMREARQAGLPPEIVPDMSIYIIILSIVFARIIFVVDDLSWYMEKPLRILMIRQGGLSFHGGVIGGALAVILYSAARRIPLRKLCDVLVRSVALGLAVGRIGCFMNGCCYGTPCHLPWAITVPALHDHVLRHPAQLYDFSISLAVFFALGPMKKFRRKYVDLLAFYFILFSIERFIVEIFRQGASSKYYYGNFMTLAQWASIPIMAAGIILFLWKPANDMIPLVAGKESSEKKKVNEEKNGKTPKKKKKK